VHGCNLLKPTPDINQIIGGALAHYATLFHIDLYSVSFLTDSFFLVAEPPKNNPCALSFFMADIKREIAKAALIAHEWDGPVFERFEATAILDKKLISKIVLDILMKPVHRYHVGDLAAWPCFSSLPEHYGKRRTFLWKGQSCHLPMVRIPGVDSRTLIDAEIARINMVPGAANRSAEEIHAWLANLDPRLFHIEKRPKRKLCIGVTPADEEAYHIRYREFADEFHQAACLLIRGVVEAIFPDPCFRPVLPNQWREHVGLRLRI
jgi:hypothetical protein